MQCAKLLQRLRWTTAFVIGAAAQWAIGKLLDSIQPELPSALTGVLGAVQWLLALIPPPTLLLLALGAALPYLAEKVPVIYERSLQWWQAFIRPWRSPQLQTRVYSGVAVVKAPGLPVRSIPVGTPPRRLPVYEVEEKLKAADLVTTILNQTQEAIDFVYETKNKAIAMLHHFPSTEVTVFDLGRCRDHVEVLKSKVDVFCLHKPQHQEFTELLEAAPTKELIAAIEHFRSAIEKLGLHLELRPGGEGSARSYLLQPFLNEIGSAMSALRKWKIQTSEKALMIRKALLEGH
jgi:hypothetical protein